MKQLGFFIDISKCISCRSCTYACSNEHTKEQSNRRKIVGIHKEKEHNIQFSTSCNHCETPACMTVCPQNCFKKLRNGIVVLNNHNCTGCQKCAAACPFDSIHVHPHTHKADKCDMCYTRLQKGLQPTCVESCIANAISVEDIYQPYPSDYQVQLKEYTMKQITNPSTRYKINPIQKTRFFQEKEDKHDSAYR